MTFDDYENSHTASEMETFSFSGNKGSEAKKTRRVICETVKGGMGDFIIAFLEPHGMEDARREDIGNGLSRISVEVPKGKRVAAFRLQLRRALESQKNLEIIDENDQSEESSKQVAC